MGKRSISKRTALAALGAAGILAIGVAVPAAAMAARGHTDSATIQDSGATWQAERHQKLAEELAEELGLDQQTVADALDQVRQEMRPEGQPEGGPWGGPHPDRRDAGQGRTDRLESDLETAVAEGTLTEEEAAAIRKAAEAGILFRGGFRGHGPGGPTN